VPKLLPKNARLMTLPKNVSCKTSKSANKIRPPRKTSSKNSKKEEMEREQKDARPWLKESVKTLMTMRNVCIRSEEDAERWQTHASLNLQRNAKLVTPLRNAS
jgi:hypothetical protein